MDWVYLVTKPTTIGTGDGFYVPKSKIKLDIKKTYVIKIIELEQFRTDLTQYGFAIKGVIKNEVINDKLRAKAS